MSETVPVVWHIWRFCYYFRLTQTNHCSLKVLGYSGFIAYNMKLLDRSCTSKRFIAVTFTRSVQPPKAFKQLSWIHFKEVRIKGLGFHISWKIDSARPDNFVPKKASRPSVGVFFFIPVQFLMVTTVKKNVEKYPKSTSGSNGWLTGEEQIWLKALFQGITL